MRRTTAVTIFSAVVLLAAVGCADGDGPEAEGSSSTTTTSPTTSTTTTDPELAPLLLSEEDVTSEFTLSTSVDDTVTTFCAGQDATAGLQASSRAVRGFTRVSGGASIIQLVFRFRDDGAATFVAQAEALLEGCSGVPDVSGLAFEYEPLAGGVETPITAVSDALVGRRGVNVGSGTFAVEVVVFHRGDVGQLVAVLGVDVPPAELDALAERTFAAVARRL